MAAFVAVALCVFSILVARLLASTRTPLRPREIGKRARPLDPVRVPRAGAVQIGALVSLLAGAAVIGVATQSTSRMSLRSQRAASATATNGNRGAFVLPLVTLLPASNTHFTSPSAFIEVDVCASSQSTATITQDGVDVTSSFVRDGNGQVSGCALVGNVWTGRVTLVSGVNALAASGCDASLQCRTRTATYYYDPPAPVPTSISISPSSKTLQANGSGSMHATVYDQNAQPMSVATMRWTSSNVGVVSVQQGGSPQDATLMGQGAGTATITAATGAVSANATVTVTAPTSVPTSIVLSPPSATLLLSGTSLPMHAAVFDQNGQAMSVATMNWSTSNSAVVTADAFVGTPQDAMLWPHTAGTATITASTGSASATATITVTAPPPPAPIVNSPSPSTVAITPGSGGVMHFSVSSGSQSQTASFGATCGGLANCVVSPISAFIGAPGTANVDVSFTAGSSQTGSFPVRLIASGPGGSTFATGTVTVQTAAPVYAITVTPSPSTSSATQGTSGIASYTVRNTSTNTTASLPISFAVSGCTAAITPCTTPASISLAQGASQSVQVSYFGATVTAPASVALTLTASTPSTPSSQGTVNVTITSPPPPPPPGTVMHTKVVGPFPGGAITRDACLTIAAGANAAFECGALRVVHALPTTTTFSKARTPVLLYNSNHAAPGTILAIDMDAGGTVPPTSIAVKVTLGGKPPVTRSFPAPTNGSTHRIAIPIDAVSLTLTDGITPVLLTAAYEIKAMVNATNPNTDVRTGTVALVDRRNSPFGAGWWLDGLEQLVSVDTTHKLWVGGDGSTRVYTRQGSSNTWLVIPAVSRPDTLDFLPSLSVWHRHLPNGAYVEFGTTGQHSRTVDALGNSTQFTYTTRFLRTVLQSVQLPVVSGAVPTYTFDYAADTAGLPRLSSVIASSGSMTRSVIVNASAGPVASIQDPDGFTTRFLSNGYVISRRINTLGDTTSFAYDEAGQLRTASIDMRRTDGPSAAPITYSFCASESRSLTSCGGGVVNTPLPATKTYTLLDGPRTDVADTTVFFVNRFGVPDTIVNALAQQTRVTRNAAFPLLADTVMAPSGLKIVATYNARGLADLVRVINPMGTGDATTRSYWNRKWNLADSVVAPTGERTMTLYDTTFALVLRTQDGRGTVSRDTFTYSLSGLLNTVLRTGAPVGNEIHYYYDASGNVSRTTTALGFVSDVARDALGRDTLVTTQVDAAPSSTRRTRVRLTYDPMDRVLTTRSIGDPSSYVLTNSGVTVNVPGDTLLVTNSYDSEGQLLSTQRIATPDTNQIGQLLTSWTYDAAHRKKSESPSGGGVEQYSVDPAGNVTNVQTRRQKSIATLYDALNRPTQRVTPSVSYAANNSCGFFWGSDIAACNTRNYRFPFYGASVDIPQDTATFTYDVTGNMATANNHDAQISRSYFPNGLLKADTLRIRAYGTSIPAPFTQHVYGLEMAYDLSGRRTSLKHPSVTAAWSCGTCTQSFAYDPQMGALRSATDVFGSPYTFDYDGRSRLVRATAPGSVVRRWSYDLDDRLILRIDSTSAAAGQLHHDSLMYDARGKVIHATASVNPGISYDYATAYSGQGAVVYTSRSKNGTFATTEQMNVDAYGNAFQHQSFTDVVHQHQQRVTFGPGSERVTGAGDYVVLGQAYVGAPVDTIKTSFDQSGNVLLYGVHRSVVIGNGTQGQSTTPVSDLGSASYYGADEKLRVFSRVGTPTSRETRAVFEEYRYDALGRRVLLRSQADSSRPSSDSLALSHIERFIWDGDQQLYEIRQPGQHSRTEAQLEAESLYGTTAPVYFGVVGYTHGAALDRPLSLIRNGQVIIPHAGFRGEYDAGTLVSGAAAGADIDWPGSEITTYAEENLTAAKGWAGSLIRDKRDESGLKYMRNRYYDARTGRFTQEDPIGLAGGMNLYGFAGGDPVNYSDPFGLCIPFDEEVCSPEETVLQFHNTVVLPIVGGKLLGMIAEGVGQLFGSAQKEETLLAANARRGRAYEVQIAKEIEAEGYTVSREVTLQTPAGARTRMDIVATSQGAATRCIECKSSPTARLTPRQATAHPQIASHGATVMGRGKPAVPGGTRIPPTRVEVRRPQ